MMGSGYGHFGSAPRLVGGFGGFGIGAGMFLLFLVVVCLVIWLLYRAARPRAMQTPTGVPPALQPTGSPVDAAMLILRERLARGEIDAEEYEKLMTTLSRTT